METVDPGLLSEASQIVRDLNNSLDHYELTKLLSGPYDKEGACLTISAGAGGTDAQVIFWLLGKQKLCMLETSLCIFPEYSMK